MADIAKVFMSGRSQAVRLPRQYRFACDEVEVTREGDAVVLRPRRTEAWSHLLAALTEFDRAEPHFAFDREQPPPQERPELDALLE